MNSSSANIAAWLAESAAQTPNAVAIVLPPGRHEARALTYAQLDFYCDHVARMLRASGIKAGMRAALMIPFGLDFFAFTFALFKLGATPVLIDPGMGIRGVGRCLADARVEAFIGSSKAMLARMLFRWGRPTLRVKVNASTLLWEYWRRKGDETPARHRLKIAEVDADATAAILFTSGSTGPAKGAVYSHSMFQEQVRILRETFGITPGEVDLCTFPLFALFAPALGMTSILAPMDYSRPARADAATLIELIGRHRVTNLFGSPAVMRVLARHADGHDVELPSLKRVISAGAPVSGKLVEKIARLLPAGAQVFTPYGATESLPIAVIGSDELLKETRQRTDAGAGICVGRAVGRIKVAVIAITDDAILSWSDAQLLSANEIGEITVSGPVVSPEYYNRPEATALHKISDGDTVWHRTGDVGYRDDEDRIWFCGRKSHRVVLGETTLDTIPCEATFNTHPEVFRTALVKAGDRPVICVELNSGCNRDRSEISRELLELGQRHDHTRLIRTILFHPSFPVDIRHNAKIFREKLAAWAEKQLCKAGAA